jgi:hypothetical protein
MKEEIFETVLNEIVEELHQSNKLVKSLNDQVQTLQTRVEELCHQSADQLAKVAPPDLGPIHESMEQGFVSIRQGTAAIQQEISATSKLITAARMEITANKSIVRQYRLSLFPENDYNGHYKYFIKWMFMTIVILVLIAGVYAFISQYSANPQSQQTSSQPQAPARIPALPHPAQPIPPRRHPRIKKNNLDTVPAIEDSAIYRTFNHDK